MRSNPFAAPLRLALRLFHRNGDLNWPLALAVLAAAVLQTLAVLIAARLDDAWFLLTPGKGFLQHYGAWAILITDPLLMFATGFAYQKYKVAMDTLPICLGMEKGREHQRLTRRWTRFVRGNGNSVFLYILFVVIGLFAWTLNVRQTINPLLVYHHDVFDSVSHPYGFVAFKACLFLSWVVVYPIAGYEFVVISISTWMGLSQLRTAHLICPMVTHPDGCYGLRNVGTLNVAILVPYLLVFAAIFSVMATHETLYGTILIPLGVVAAIFIATSFIVIMPVRSLLKHAKEEAYRELVHKASGSQKHTERDTFKFAAERFFYATANASPYSTGTRAVLFAMRSIPIVTFVLKLAQQYHVQVWRW